MRAGFALASLFGVAVLLSITLPAAEEQPPSASALLVLYDFAEDSGPIVRDRSGAGAPIDLKIDDMKQVNRSAGSLKVTGDTILRSEQVPTRLIDEIQRSGEITIEAWVTPANTTQRGPARIVTLSRNANERNMTLGQYRDAFDVRLRTTRTSTNGLPSLSQKQLETKRTHVVFTRNGSGRTRLFLNGQLQASGTAVGEMSNWDDEFRLALANEHGGGRAWRGTYHLVALYSRALSAGDIARHFRSGPSADAVREIAAETRESVGTQGLIALYDFDDESGPIVRDRSGSGEPIDLKIEDMKQVKRSPGSLEVTGETLIRSERPPTRMSKSIERSGEITVEAWITPANIRQEGPARIVTISKDSSNRNVTLGQEKDTYDVRLRTTRTSTNGIPSLSTDRKSLEAKRTHVVYTRDRSGRARIYLNGRQNEEQPVEGATSNWDGTFQLALGNEFGGGRSWRGTYHLVAIYSRALSAGDVTRHFKAGPRSEVFTRSLASTTSPQDRHFREHVASLFAKHCIECHDPAVKEGGLDLSRKVAALKGGDSGRVVIAGKAAESILWERVSADEMPPERDPLSPEEKQALKKWIDEGAVWSMEVIDPALYAHGSHAPENFLRRLTVNEYIATVKTATGVDISQEARELLPPDIRADGFSNTAYNLGVDLKHIEVYAQLAEIIVSRMDVKEYAVRFSKSRKLSTDDTMREFIGAMGKWILRGPLDDREVTSYSGIATTVASAGGDFDDAVGLLIQAMLQSPRFLYRVENQVGDGTTWPAGPFELASRMSYILWGSPPDRDLMQAAEGGDLFDPAAVERQVDRMLADPRARERSREFITQWLNLDRLDNLAPNPGRFPDWTPELAADMRTETLAFFDEVVWTQNRPLADLLNAQVTFLTPRLAKHYGILPLADDRHRYDVTRIPGRGGILTQGSILTIGGDEASMVTRGLFVLHDLLRGVVKDPPPCVDTTPVPSKPGLTQRSVAESRIADASCGGCHGRFEPLAFGLEKFDGLGTFREQDEHGNPLREDGVILIPGTAEPVSYKTAAELMNVLAESDRVKETMTWKVTQFALGRPLTVVDAETMVQIHESAQQYGGTYSALMKSLVLSDLVQTTRTEQSR